MNQTLSGSNGIERRADDSVGDALRDFVEVERLRGVPTCAALLAAARAFGRAAGCMLVGINWIDGLRTVSDLTRVAGQTAGRTAFDTYRRFAGPRPIDRQIAESEIRLEEQAHALESEARAFRKLARSTRADLQRLRDLATPEPSPRAAVRFARPSAPVVAADANPRQRP